MQHKISIWLTLFLFFLITFSVFADEIFEDFQPIINGMTLKFIHTVERTEQKERTWQIKVVKNSFPESLAFTWVKKEKNGAESNGTRILTNPNSSRNFNPWFVKNETKDTNDTAPWISVQILKELQEHQKSEKFREGGTGALNWIIANLVVKEKILFPVMINGQAEAIHAFKLNKGLTVWNNLKNPLVLEYKPLGIPLLSNISGWKLISIEY